VNDATEMKLFLGFRLHQADVNLVDEAGAKLPSVALDDFATIMSGAIIEF
jgi:hypothetical protein